MQANRCGMPDINLDDAGNLDENSLQLIESVIGKGTKVTTATLTTSVTIKVTLVTTNTILITVDIFPDKVKEHRRRKRWVASHNRLDKTDLLYKLTNFATSLPNQVQTNDIDQAFQRWDNASPLTLTKVRAKSRYYFN